MPLFLPGAGGLVAVAPQYADRAIVGQGAPSSLPTFLETFETGNFQPGWDAAVISGTGTLTVKPEAAYAGGFGLHVQKPYSDASCYRRYTFPATDTLMASGRYRWLSDSGTSSNGAGPRFGSPAGRIVDAFRQDQTGEIGVRYASTAATNAGSLFLPSTGIIVPLGTSVNLELECTFAAGANSRIRLWIDGVLRADQSGLTVFAGGYTWGQVGSEHTAQFLDVYVDNVSFSPAPSTPPPITSNSLYSEGALLKNVSDGSTFYGRAMNVQGNGFAYAQADWDAMSAAGINLVRLGMQWRLIEPQQNSFDAAQIAYVQTNIARAAAASPNPIYVHLALCFNAPVWSYASTVLPGWSYNASGPTNAVAPFNTQSLFDVMVTNGQGYIQYVVGLFYDDPNVVMIEASMNEPDRFSGGALPGAPADLIARGTNIMLGWARAADLDGTKLWPVATGCYSSQNPATANNDWTQITNWTNVLFQHHTYFCPQSTGDDGWNTTDGMRSSGDGTYLNGSPIPSSYSTANKSSFADHFAPLKAIADQYGVPWILGEFGSQYNQLADATQRDEHARDLVQAAGAAGAAGVYWWIYGTNTAQDPWSARPSSVWRPEALRVVDLGGGGAPPPPPTAVELTFESPAGNNITLTTANTPELASVSIASGATLATDNTQWLNGAQSLKAIVGATAGVAQIVITTFAGATTIHGRTYMRLSSTPTNLLTFFRPVSGSTTRLYLGIAATTRKIALLNTSTAIVFQSTNTLPVTTWVRVEWTFNLTTGAYNVTYYSTPTSTTPTETLSGTGAAFGGTATEYRGGLAGFFASQPQVNFDDYALDTAGPLGP